MTDTNYAFIGTKQNKGIALLRECSKPVKCVVIQPGASGEELLRYLQEQQIPYINGCLLAGLSKYGPDQN